MSKKVMQQALTDLYCNDLDAAVTALQAALAEPDVMVDMTPPATSRDRWMYEQGRLAERDPRTRTHAMPADPDEPVAWIVYLPKGHEHDFLVFTDLIEAQNEAIEHEPELEIVPLYTHPPCTEPMLTKERIKVIWWDCEARFRDNKTDEWWLQFAHAILAAAVPHGHVLVPVEQLQHWLEYWNGNENERAMADALHHILGEIEVIAARPGAKHDRS